MHEPALRLLYQNILSFSEILNPGNSLTEHQKNVQVHVTEIYKI